MLLAIKDRPRMQQQSAAQDRDKMRTEIEDIYTRLRAVRMDQHARDFWTMRARKQQGQVESDALLHQHTALSQYMLWHDVNGARLPSFQRNTALCLQHLC